MPRSTSRVPASALGFRVKSGFAVCALVAGRPVAPELIRLSEIDLSDRDRPESRQPYHHGFGELETDRRKLARRIAGVRLAAHESVARLLESVRPLHAPVTAGLVVGSLVDPSSISNPHIRAHALEGRLFRSVLEEALHERGVSTSVFVERSVYLDGAVLVGSSQADLRQRVHRLPHPPGPWRGEQKLATLAAWLVLIAPPAKEARRRRRPAPSD